MRLLSVIHNPVFGGGLNEYVRLRGPLQRRGWETLAVISDAPGNAADRLDEAGAQFVQMPLHRLRATMDPLAQGKFAFSFRREVRALRRLIRERSIDLVQAHGDTNPHAAIAGHLDRRAVVWHLYDTRTPAPLRHLTMPVVTRLADAITTVGEELARVHPGALSLGERQLTVFPPVDANEFRPNETRRASGRSELGIAEDAFLVGAVGNRNPTKGYEWLVRAVSCARAGNARIEARILGSPSPVHAAYEQMLRSEIADRRLDSKIVLTDPGGRVAQLMPALDVLVVSSVPRSEGIPTVILEAMACGLPVIATDVGAISEVVEDGVTGFLVPPEDADAISSRIMQLAGESNLGRTFGETGRKRVLDRYDLDHCAERRARAYEIAVAHRRARTRR
jgi:glycosyltransferase involved in cell wall biosynthesis